MLLLYYVYSEYKRICPNIQILWYGSLRSVCTGGPEPRVSSFSFVESLENLNVGVVDPLTNQLGNPVPFLDCEGLLCVVEHDNS